MLCRRELFTTNTRCTPELSLFAVIHKYIALMLVSLIALRKLLMRGDLGWCYVALPLLATRLLASLLPMLELQDRAVLIVIVGFVLRIEVAVVPVAITGVATDIDLN
jgi:hypothetical protein